MFFFSRMRVFFGFFVECAVFFVANALSWNLCVFLFRVFLFSTSGLAVCATYAYPRSGCDKPPSLSPSLSPFLSLSLSLSLSL